MPGLKVGYEAEARVTGKSYAEKIASEEAATDIRSRADAKRVKKDKKMLMQGPRLRLRSRKMWSR